MAVQKVLVGTIPLLFVTVGLSSATGGVLAPAGGGQPVAGALLVAVGITVFASLWLVGWWSGDEKRREAS